MLRKTDEKVINLGIGATAGVISRTLVAPLERLKILHQVTDKINNGYINCLKNIVHKEGFKGLFAGNGTNCIRILPKTSIQYMSFELFNKYFDNRYLTGGLSGMVTTLCMYPLESIRSRLSVQNHKDKGAYKGIFDCSKSIYRNYGLRGFYRGIDITLVGSIPLYAINFGLFNFFQEKLGGNTLKNNFIAGNFSMLGSLSLVYPSDLIRRRMQLRGEFGVPQYVNWIQCAKDMIKKEGKMSLYRGIRADYFKMLPANGMFFVLVGLMKKYAFD